MSMPYYADELITLYHGDCREILPRLTPESVDLVLTDPPYPAKFQHLYGEMAQAVVPTMREGASLVSLCGHYQVPSVLDAYMGAGLRFWWIAGMSHTSKVRMPGKWVRICWKPALWFVKGRRRPGDTHVPMDMVASGGKDKTHHEWGQGVAWFRHWAAELAPSDEHLILDPFTGGGTTLLVAREMGRRAIGIEVDERACEAAAVRLQSADTCAPRPRVGSSSGAVRAMPRESVDRITTEVA